MPPEQISQPEKGRGELRAIRTFQSDVEEVIKRRQVSKATIVIAEGERQAAAEKSEAQTVAPPLQAPSKVFHIAQGLPASPGWNIKSVAPLAVVLLLLAGAGIGISFYVRGGEPPRLSGPTISVPPSVAITLKGNESRTGIIKTIQSRLGALSVPQNELRTIPITLEAAPITAAELFDRLETAAPEPLVRALGAVPTLGVHGFRGGQPFLLFSVSSYDHAFAGMLSWEPELLHDIGPLFGVVPQEILAGVSSTTAGALLNTLAVKDVIVRNKDARAISDPKGSVVFLYSFVDKQTLVFTTNEETLKILISRAGEGRLR